MLFPSFIAWSAMTIKDCLIQLLIVIIFSVIAKNFSRIAWPDFAILFFSLAFLFTLQKNVIYVAIAVVIIAYFLIWWRWNISRKNNLNSLIKLLIFLGLMAGLCFLFYYREHIQNIFIRFMDGLINHQRAQVAADEAGYSIYPPNINGSSITFPVLFFAYIKGLLYAFFSPFPWSIKSLNQFQAYPQMLFCYFSIPFAIIGLFYGLLCCRRQIIFIILMFALTMISLLALSEGNIGGVFRHRDWLNIFYLMFVAAGLTKVFFKADKLPH
jgi:flagellar biosynthesis protein FlhB